LAAKEAKESEKLAAKEAKEAEKLAAKEAKESESLAAKEAEKLAAKEAEKLAAKEAKEAEKLVAKEESKKEPEEEVESVKKINEDGKTYLRSKKTGIIYDYEKYKNDGDQVIVGQWNETTQKIVFKEKTEESDGEESEDEYDEE
jgi:mRNA-degrading endonuclease RelE of RelBE toxin-antitoxin system